MEDLRITPKLTLSHKELQITTARSSGPGGQNVNKVNTKATLRWNPFRCDHFPVGWRKRFTEQNCNRMTKEGEIVLQSDRYRDQKKNIQDVRQRLVQLLVTCEHPPKKRKPTKPTKGSQRRRLKNKREQAEKKALRSNQLRLDSWHKIESYSNLRAIQRHDSEPCVDLSNLFLANPKIPSQCFDRTPRKHNTRRWKL